MSKREEKTWTLIDIVNWGADYFNKKHIDSPRLTIELMLCKLLKMQRIDIYSNFDKPLRDNELTELRDMVKRRLKREPLQYILGTTNFFGIELDVDGGTLVPRPETELLVEEVLNYLDKNPSDRILDIGAGSGCISIALAKKHPESQVIGIDISDKAIETSRKNARKLKVNNIDFFKADILADDINEIMTNGQKYDLIVSNPPYIELDEYKKLEPELLNYEPRIALTDESNGLTFYKRFAEIFPGMIKRNGSFFFEIGYGQKNFIERIFAEKGIALECKNDLSGIPRIMSYK